ncbi:MAG: thiamine phosphate synthase [Pseudobacter sp.]|uniref:thiamine phosphate synthase n=1 Tax=Pseudobacter sp. TaxID=2045420 RepID=UPI003F7E2E37
MNKEFKKIKGGVYLVLDPASLDDGKLKKVRQALDSGLAAIQLWNNWMDVKDRAAVVQYVVKLAKPFQVPVLVNENWELLTETDADGIHFDQPSQNLSLIRGAIGRPLITGITCGNNLDNVQFAIEQKMDYISFCSVFPSGSANSCEWVQPATIAAARAMSDMTIFAAGGITAQNLPALLPTGLDGIAVINSIMKAEDPSAVTSQFNQILQQQKIN